MNWNDVNVFQYQQLMNLFIKKEELSEIDLSYKVISILTGKTERQIDSLSIGEMNRLLKEINFIHTELNPEPKKYIHINKKRYKCLYDVRKLKVGRYIESQHFASNVTDNLHKIAASMIVPQKKTLFGWKDVEYDAAYHEDYSNDMLEASITSVLGSVVFFYQVYKHSIKNLKDYLISEMKLKKMNQIEAESLYQVLCDNMDGFIKPNWLVTTRKSIWKKLLNYPQFNF